ncbi:MAG TPA: hypothetical protein DEP05_03085 [Betaproteobacteria bacterium]|nr:hypothetical protein [Betaproteobacteria bacterium]
MPSLANYVPRVHAVHQQFADALPLKLYEINRLWNRAQRGLTNTLELGQLPRLAHELKRLADASGCRQVSEQAAGLERLFQTLRFSQPSPSSRQIVEIALSLDTLDDAAHEAMRARPL